jgi:hypothetical protein
MEDGVSLIEPAGLRVNEVGKGASGKRRSAIAIDLCIKNAID